MLFCKKELQQLILIISLLLLWKKSHEEWKKWDQINEKNIQNIPFLRNPAKTSCWCFPVTLHLFLSKSVHFCSPTANCALGNSKSLTHNAHAKCGDAQCLVCCSKIQQLWRVNVFSLTHSVLKHNLTWIHQNKTWSVLMWGYF